MKIGRPTKGETGARVDDNFLEQPWLTEDDSEMGGSAMGEELLIFPDTPIFGSLPIMC